MGPRAPVPCGCAVKLSLLQVAFLLQQHHGAVRANSREAGSRVRAISHSTCSLHSWARMSSQGHEGPSTSFSFLAIAGFSRLMADNRASRRLWEV